MEIYNYYEVAFLHGYIVLTEQMEDRVSPTKHAQVLEGHVDSNMAEVETTVEGKHQKKA